MGQRRGAGPSANNRRRSMYFYLVATKSDKYIRATDLLSKDPHRQPENCTKDVPKKFTGFASSGGGSDSGAGLVKVEVSRDGATYYPHYDRLDVYEGGEPVEIDDTNLPRKRNSRKAEESSAPAEA